MDPATKFGVLGIKTANLFDVLHPVVYRYLEQFSKYPEVEGIAVLGGAACNGSRRFLDRFSDLDGSIFLSVPLGSEEREISIQDFLARYQFRLPSWLPPFEVHLPCSAHPDGQVEINTHQQIMQLEGRPWQVWDEGRREAYTETCDLIFDRTGAVRELIKEKCSWKEPEAFHTLLRVLGQLKWYCDVNPKRQIERGFIHNGHDLLNQALDHITHAAFLINRRYRPHAKWRLQTLFNLPIQPPGFQKGFQAAMLVKGFGTDDLTGRIDLVSQLSREIRELAGKHYRLPPDPYALSCRLSYDDRQLLDSQEPVSLNTEFHPAPDSRSYHDRSKP